MKTKLLKKVRRRFLIIEDKRNRCFRVRDQNNWSLLHTRDFSDYYIWYNRIIPNNRDYSRRVAINYLIDKIKEEYAHTKKKTYTQIWPKKELYSKKKSPFEKIQWFFKGIFWD